MKKKLLVLPILFSLAAILAFKVPVKVSTENISVATDVTGEFEEVTEELKILENDLAKLMTPKEKLAWTPLAAIVGAVRASVAVTRVAVAVSMAASEAVALATRISGGQLLTTVLFMARASKAENIEHLKKLKEFKLYELG
jgi:hypothetical protein